MKSLPEVERKIQLQTDSDYDNLFEKLATELEPSSFKEYKETVNNLFHGNEKIAKNLDRWEEKLNLDRKKLRELF